MVPVPYLVNKKILLFIGFYFFLHITFHMGLVGSNWLIFYCVMLQALFKMQIKFKSPPILK